MTDDDPNTPRGLAGAGPAPLVGGTPPADLY